jgi:endo-1,4-beta-D-glucanase Y
MVKPDRKNINVATLEKVKQFLKEQENPVFKSDIVKGANVDFHSVTLALTMLNVRINKDRRVKLKC